jgi:hypothetical protein
MPNADLLPRFEIQRFDAFETREVLLDAGLDDAAFDARAGGVLATHGLLDLLANVEAEAFDQEDEVSSRSSGLAGDAAVVLPSMDRVSPNSPVLPLVYNGHRLALLVVAQREGATTPAPYLLPEAGRGPTRTDFVCCAYVRVDHDGGTTVLLDGWVDGTRLRTLPRQTRAGEKCRRLDVTALRPMHELWVRLQSRRRRTLADSKSLFGPAAATAVKLLPAAAAVLFAILWLWYPRTSTRPPSYTGGPVVEWQVASRAPGMRAVTPTRVVRGGDDYTVNLRVLSGRRFGWMYQVDGREAHLLDRLEPRPDGSLAGEHRGVFDDFVGLEYLALILSDRDLPALSSADGPATWLTRDQIQQIQDFARRGEDDQAAQVLRTALERLGWQGTTEDLRLERIDHRPR